MCFYQPCLISVVSTDKICPFHRAKQLSDPRSEVTSWGGGESEDFKEVEKPGFPHRNWPHGIILQISCFPNSHQLCDYLIGVRLFHETL